MKTVLLKNFLSIYFGALLGFSVFFGMQYSNTIFSIVEMHRISFFLICGVVSLVWLSLVVIFDFSIEKKIDSRNTIFTFLLYLISHSLYAISYAISFTGIFILIENNYSYFVILSITLFALHYKHHQEENSPYPIFMNGVSLFLVLFFFIENNPEKFAYISILGTGYCLGITGYLFKKTSGEPIF